MMLFRTGDVLLWDAFDSGHMAYLWNWSTGALTYVPHAGTILSVGADQTLTVTAAATDDYNFVFVGVANPGEVVHRVDQATGAGAAGSHGLGEAQPPGAAPPA